MMPTIGAVIIARNESEMIANCLETLRWCDEVIVIDNDSVDNTASVAEKLGAKVVQLKGGFAQLRNEGLRRCKTDWLLYIDADERVTPTLANEIRQVIEHPTHQAYSLKRNNILYGRVVEYGGWQADWVVRLFERVALKEWAGEIHEHAVVDGTTGQLLAPLAHLTHRDVVSGLLKTAEWTPIEARLLFEAHHPRVGVLTLIRKTGMEFFRRLVIKQGYRDGMVGWIEAMIQAMNRFLVYVQLWELQQRPSLPERYRRYEESIVELWKRET